MQVEEVVVYEIERVSIESRYMEFWIEMLVGEVVEI